MGVNAQIEPPPAISVPTDDPSPSTGSGPALAFTLAGPAAPVAVGDTVTLTGQVDNLSPYPLTSMQLDVPPHTAVTYTAGPTIPPEGIPGGTLELGDLPAAIITPTLITTSMPITLTARVTGQPAGGLLALPFHLRTAATDPLTATVTLSVTLSLNGESGGESGDGDKGLAAPEAMNSEPARWQMAYTPPGVSSFTGAATTSYPIVAPPGIGGLTPALNISYNSRGFEGLQAPYAASGFGVGWGMPQPQITNGNAAAMFDTDPDNFGACDPFQNSLFTLSLNGASYPLQARSGVYRHGRYDALGDPSLFIEYKNSGATNVTGEYWLVKTADGTSYIFGQSEQAEQVVSPLLDACSENWQNGLQPQNKNFAALSWKLESITDVYGRQVKYSYGTACSEHFADGTGCRRFPIATFVAESYTFPSPTPNQSGNHFRREADVALYRIEYNFVGGSPQTIIQFDYSAWNWDTLRHKKWMATGHYRPAHVTIRHAGQTIAGYVFSYGQSNHYTSWDDRSTTFWWLTGVTTYGSDFVYSSTPPGTALPATTFSYEQNTKVCGPDVGGTTRCLPILTKVDNGYGGVSRFVYARYDGSGNINANGDWFVVKELYTWDGVRYPYNANNNTAASRLLYERTGFTACYDKDGSGCRSLSYEPSNVLVGFNGVTLSTQAYVSGAWTTLSKSQEEFDTSTYWKNGKTTWQRTLTPGTTSKLTEEKFTWTLVGVDAQLTRQDHYLYADGNTLHTYETFSYLNGSGHYGALYQQKAYREEVNGSNTLYRCTEHAYAHQTSGGVWLVNRPLRQTLYQGNCGGTKMAETLYRYDAPTSPTDTDLDGKAALEYTLVWRGNLPNDSNYVTTRQTYYSSGANVGLPYETITYKNYSTTTAFATTVRNTTRVTGYNALGLPTGSQMIASGLTTLSQGVSYDTVFAWLPATTTDANGAVTGYKYDKFGRLTKVIRPGDTEANPTVSYSYWDNTANNGTLFTKPLLIQTAYNGSNGVRQFYDGLGRLVQEQSPNANIRYGSNSFGQRDVITTYAYDARGLLTCQTMPYDVAPYVWNGQTPYRNDICTSYARTTNTYDTLGRVLKTTAPDGTITGYHHYGILAQGNEYVTWHDVIDANRHRTTQRYDAWGRLVQVNEFPQIQVGRAL